MAVKRIIDSRVYVYETEAEAKEEYENLFVKCCEDDEEVDVKILYGKISEISHIKQST